MSTQNAASQAAPGSLERGSFRDRDSRVFYKRGEVYRFLSERGLEEWELLSATSFFPRMIAAGKIVATERTTFEDFAPEEHAGWAAVLKHERIPFVSYPYEWSFGMLRQAALSQLELMAAALEEDMVLKDASPYNTQWVGSRPVFIDVPSFVRQEPGEPWAGYRQFCELFLYPLMLLAYKGVDYHPWLRGSIDGIPAEQFRGLMGGRDLLRPGVLLHVKLQAMLQVGSSGSDKDVRKELRDAGFNKELIQANVKKLTKLVTGLRWKATSSTWSDYTETNTYDEANRQRKAEFVRAAVADAPRRTVWDLGCNTGEYSRIAAEQADQVVSMDSDHLAVERLYQALRSEQGTSILPLLVKLNDASPNLGWRGAERQGLLERGSPDLVLALALIHHMVISANIPLEEFVGWLASMESDLVIEFVTKADSMVQTLLRNKEDKYTDYDRSLLERALGEHFEIVRSEVLAGETRVMYYCRRSSR